MKGDAGLSEPRELDNDKLPSNSGVTYHEQRLLKLNHAKTGKCQFRKSKIITCS